MAKDEEKKEPQLEQAELSCRWCGLKLTVKRHKGEGVELDRCPTCKKHVDVEWKAEKR